MDFKRILAWLWLFVILAAGAGAVTLWAADNPLLQGIMAWSIGSISLRVIAAFSMLIIALMTLAKVPFDELM